MVCNVENFDNDNDNTLFIIKASIQIISINTNFGDVQPKKIKDFFFCCCCFSKIGTIYSKASKTRPPMVCPP